MGSPEREGEPGRTKRAGGFPWLELILLLGTIYLFWVLPGQLPKRPVKVEFAPTGGK